MNHIVMKMKMISIIMEFVVLYVVNQKQEDMIIKDLVQKELL
jgi:hypothetical protein